MLSIEIFFLKAALVFPLFAFYLGAIGIFISAAKQSDSKCASIFRCAGYVLIITNVIVDLARWTKPLPHHLTESLMRISMFLAGVGVGMVLAAVIQRKNP
jgi:L-lactate permease